MTAEVTTPYKKGEHPSYAPMAELADAIDSGSIVRKYVEVQVLLGAPKPCRLLWFTRLIFLKIRTVEYHSLDF